jgi:hypothetical protein
MQDTLDCAEAAMVVPGDLVEVPGDNGTRQTGIVMESLTGAALMADWEQFFDDRSQLDDFLSEWATSGSVTDLNFAQVISFDEIGMPYSSLFPIDVVSVPLTSLLLTDSSDKRRQRILALVEEAAEAARLQEQENEDQQQQQTPAEEAKQ